jgi:DNA-binding IscR family transcriptional regulator
MGDLRSAGLVMSKAGPAGGFVLARSAHEITLDAVYDAIAEDDLFPRHARPNMKCPIGKAIGPVLDQVYGGVQSAVRRSLSQTRLGDLVGAAREPEGQ